VRFLAAPNPFKGSLGAPAAAHAIALGIRDAVPEAEVIEVPVADGGEGTVEALVSAAGGELVGVRVEGPLGDPVEASFGLIDGGRTAVVELASASGLPLLPEGRRDPRFTSTFGFGQLLEAARRSSLCPRTDSTTSRTSSTATTSGRWESHCWRDAPLPIATMRKRRASPS
jgi:glycerate kinase